MKRFARGPLRVLISRDPVGASGELRWHLSMSTEDRQPTWDELADARYDLLPDEVTMAMLLPPRAEYVNAHPFTLHLYEIDPGVES